MGSEPRDAAAGRRSSDDAGSDAMWRPDGRVAVAPRDGPRRPARAEPKRAPTRPTSPWSREAIEAPLPTVDEIRERWRGELGLDDAPPRVADPIVRPRRDDDRPHSTASGDLVLGAIVVALLLVVAGGVVWALRSPMGGPPSATDPLPALDTGPAWSIELDEPVEAVAVADGVLALRQPDGIHVRDGATGEIRWSAALAADGANHRIAIYDGVVMVVSSTSVDVAAAYDLESGALLWQRAAPLDGTYVLVDDAPIEVAGAVEGEAVVHVVDPATGAAVGAGVLLRRLPAPDGYVVGQVGDDLALLELATGEVVAPTVPTFGLRAIAPIGDRVVGFTVENEIVVFDDDGVAADQRPFVSDAFGDFAGRAELVGGVPDTSIGIVASGTSVGVDVSGAQIEMVWELPGRVLGPIVETDAGPRAVARLVDDETGLVEIAVVDVVDGSVVAVTNGGGDREDVPQLWADGYVVPPAVGDPERALRAVGYDGGERWSLALGRSSVGWVVGDGSLYILEDGSLTAYR